MRMPGKNTPDLSRFVVLCQLAENPVCATFLSPDPLWLGLFSCLLSLDSCGFRSYRCVVVQYSLEDYFGVLTPTLTPTHALTPITGVNYCLSAPFPGCDFHDLPEDDPARQSHLFACQG